MKQQMFVFVKGWIQVVEGVIQILSLGLIYPQWTTNFTGWYLLQIFDAYDIKNKTEDKYEDD